MKVESVMAYPLQLLCSKVPKCRMYDGVIFFAFVLTFATAQT